MRPTARLAGAIGALCAIAMMWLPPAAAAGTCSARSTTPPPRVVELYTSEGCSSCPPADAWLATLKGRSDVIALGFHVTYWDRLGWSDRFAAPAYTQRQIDWAALHGSSGVYTPQVLVNGRDWRGWPQLPEVETAAAPPPQLTLARAADGSVTAHVQPLPGSSVTLRGFWAVSEDGHSSRVRAGENAGATLRHDHVVRLLEPVAPWAARDGLQSRLDVNGGAPEYPRRVVFVVTEAGSRRPLQALALLC